MDTTLPPDFKEFLKLLNAHSVEYLLIGGYAVGYHGYPRATKDIDIWIAFHPDNASRIVAALRDFGFDVPELTSNLFLKDRSIVRMGVPPMRIEITTHIDGVEFAECYAARVKDTIDDVPVTIHRAPCKRPVFAPNSTPTRGYATAFVIYKELNSRRTLTLSGLQV